MNFFNSTLVKEEGDLWIDAGAFRIQVPDERKSMYSGHVGKEVIFGIRPEHIHAPEYATPNITPAPMSATVEVAELLGSEVNLFLSAGKHSFGATLDPRVNTHPGSKIDLVMDMNHMHLFDKDTEIAIR